MLELTKDIYSQDTYGYYDQHGNRYIFLSPFEVKTFLLLYNLDYVRRLANAAI